MSENLHAPLFVSFYYRCKDGRQGHGFRVMAHDFIVNAHVASGEDIECIRETIIESTEGFEDVVILNFRRMEP